MNSVQARGLVAGMLLLVSGVGSAQQLPAFTTLSARSAPTSTDRAVIRQRYLDIPVPEMVSDAARSSLLRLDLFPDVSFRAVRERAEATANGVAWHGVLDGYPLSSAVFVLVDDVLLGHISAPFGFFRIERGADGVALVQQVDQSLLQEGRDDFLIPPAAEGRAVAAAADVSAPADSGSQLDLMVVYTADAISGFGGSSQTRAAIDLAIAETNQAFRNTGVNTSFRLVHAREISYSESGNSSTDLNRLQDTRDGYMDDVHALRNQYAADFVLLIVERMTDAGGRGWVTYNSGYTYPDYAFSIVSRRSSSNGRTFAHELGHNMGAQHDWYVSAGDTGAFSYSYGYTSLAGRFLDIMSYYDLCTAQRISCTQLNQYSNPRLSQGGYRTGVPAGTNTSCTKGVVASVDCDADLGTTFNNTINTLANYRNSATITNRAPTVSASCNPCTVGTAQTSTLTASASDPDGDAITLRWTATQGTFSSTSAGTTVWTAPSQVATVTATITATDSRGAAGSATVTLNVVVSDRLPSNGQLGVDQSMRSANGRFRLLFQGDGNLVLYDDQTRTAVWSTNTGGGARPTRVVMQSDGNLVLYDGQGVARFSTSTGGNTGGASLLLQNDGNLVIYRGDGRVLWDRFTGRQTVAPAGCSVQDIGVGGSASGSWASDCNATHRSGAYARYYRFSLTSTRTIQASLASSADTYLFLLRGSDQNGSVITEDDDSGDGTNSLVSVSLSAGTYVLEATTYDTARTGSFTLTLAAPAGSPTDIKRPAKTGVSKKPVQ
jgi:hypothetical protein